MIIDRMSNYPGFVDTEPLRLSAEEKEDPMRAIADFFFKRHLNDLRADLENLLAIALSADVPDMNNHLVRNNLVSLRYDLEALAEANFLLYQGINTGQIKIMI